MVKKIEMLGEIIYKDQPKYTEITPFYLLFLFCSICFLLMVFRSLYLWDVFFIIFFLILSPIFLYFTAICRYLEKIIKLGILITNKNIVVKGIVVPLGNINKIVFHTNPTGLNIVYNMNDMERRLPYKHSIKNKTTSELYRVLKELPVRIYKVNSKEKAFSVKQVKEDENPLEHFDVILEREKINREIKRKPFLSPFFIQ